MCLLSSNPGFADWEHKSIDAFLAKYEDLISMPRPHLKKKKERKEKKGKRARHGDIFLTTQHWELRHRLISEFMAWASQVSLIDKT